jgi:hypothetical protein
VLVLSVALAGTAYAAWTTQITFTGSVSTGNLDVEITGVAENNDEITVTVADDKNSFNVIVANVYPGWVGYVDFAVTNTGSLPVTIEIPVVNEDSDPANLDDYLDIATSPFPSSLPANTFTVVRVTLSVDDSPLVPQGATATYSGSVTFKGP